MFKGCLIIHGNLVWHAVFLVKENNIINISYNYLNLPEKIDKEGGTRLEYLYDAAGNKLRQLEYKEGILRKTTDFVANFVFINGKPAWYNFDEGRVVYKSEANYYAESYLKDHLGSVRVAFGYENGTFITRQVNSYYPFGMNIKGLTANSVTTKTAYPNEYLYNGKMQQDEMNLGRLDYGARMYDAVIGRWRVIDNKAEKYYSITPYAYATNNPILFIDPNGKEIVDAKGNKISYSEKSGWSKNATESVKIVYQALQETETGREQWNKAVSSDRKMSFDISEEIGYVDGELANGDVNRAFSIDASTGKRYLSKDEVQEIIIYKGTLEDYPDAKYNGLSLRQAVGAVAGHEIEHATNEANIKETAINKQYKGKIHDTEKTPREISKKIAQEGRDLNINAIPIKPAVILL